MVCFQTSFVFHHLSHSAAVNGPSIYSIIKSSKIEFIFIFTLI